MGNRNGAAKSRKWSLIVIGAATALTVVIVLPQAAFAGTRASTVGGRPLEARGSAVRSLHPLLALPGAVTTARDQLGGLRPAIVSPGSTTSQLDGAVCTSSSNCWAVGSYNNTDGATLNQILHWNGVKWSQVATPDPAGTTASTDDNELERVTCVSALDCWSVGDTSTSPGPRLNQILHWDGGSWTESTAPSPGGTGSGDRSDLIDVTCVSASKCFAAGYYDNAAGGGLDEILEWSGSHWSVMSTPQPGGSSAQAVNELIGITCYSASECWAVGAYGNSSGAELNEILKWNGTKWSTSQVADLGTDYAGAENVFFDVRCMAANDCLAVGGYLRYTTAEGIYNEVAQWNGKTWTQSKVLSPGIFDQQTGSVLESLECTSSTNCWAVGEYEDVDSAEVNQALQWNGSSWSLASTPNPGGYSSSSDVSALVAVACSAATRCWAVGYYSALSDTLNAAFHWNGAAWFEA